MTQKERRVFLINYLKNEEESFKGIVIPHDTEAQKHLLRALMNVRPPMPVSKDFTDIQDVGLYPLVIYLRNSRRSISGKGILPAFLLMQS